jgi:hypothetical protein
MREVRDRISVFTLTTPTKDASAWNGGTRQFVQEFVPEQKQAAQRAACFTDSGQARAQRTGLKATGINR